LGRGAARRMAEPRRGRPRRGDRGLRDDRTPPSGGAPRTAARRRRAGRRNLELPPHHEATQRGPRDDLHSRRLEHARRADVELTPDLLLAGRELLGVALDGTRAVGSSVLDGCDRERGAHALPTETGAHREAYDRPDPVVGRVFLTPRPRHARTREAPVVRAGLGGPP